MEDRISLIRSPGISVKNSEWTYVASKKLMKLEQAI
jgi:hypothetical protein